MKKKRETMGLAAMLLLLALLMFSSSSAESDGPAAAGPGATPAGGQVNVDAPSRGFVHQVSTEPRLVHRGARPGMYAMREGRELPPALVQSSSFEAAPPTEVRRKEQPQIQDHFEKMSPMGRLAHLVATARIRLGNNGNGLSFRLNSGEICLLGDEDCSAAGFQEGPAAGQSETTIAIDATGRHIVVGFNDFRGVSLNPISVSGFAYSDDGGATFTDGGQLPTPGTSQLSDGTKLPQIFGDPDVKYVPGGAGCQFIYSSIMIEGFGTPTGNVFPGTAETMSIHRSTDCGHTWSGPFEVTAATNPTGVSSGNNARDAADKEFMDVDPDTGRVIMSWSNFTATSVIPGGVQISTAFSDNIMSATPPTWSTRSVLNPGSTTFDTGSMPRFAGNGSNNVYVAWSRESTTIFAANTAIALSINNGGSWASPFNLNTSDFFPMDYVLGNDRVHDFPSIAVDNSLGASHGNVYVVYASNNSKDGSDISFHRSTNNGASFSTAISLNSRPGADRPQWFPYVTVDSTSGRVSVIYYDQGIAGSGDLMETTWIYSDDGGVTWSKPSPLTSSGCVAIGASPLDCRPFHAGYGNDTGQPNLGDYIGATAQGGNLYAVWGGNPRNVSFTDGQPTANYTVPDFYFRKASAAQAALSLGPITYTDSGGNGFLDPGELGNFTVPLKNYVTNATTGTVTYTGVSATFSTSTAGVTILQGTSSYPDIAPGLTQSNTPSFLVQLSPSFVAGTKIEFSLNVTASQGSTTLFFAQNTGTPVPTTIFSESFNSVSPGTLPAGWATIHVGGTPTVPWTTNNTFCGTTSNGLFHINANDGAGGNNTRFERVASPNIVVPASAEYVTLDFDICYDTEDDPNFNVLAYDGATLRITDFTTGRFARANLVEAFAESIVTGSFFHFPKHTPRNSDPNYFQDMSVWAGFSGGFQHVSMRLPGMAGSTVQLRPDYTQDSIDTCANVRPGHTCGVMIDNILMKSVVSAAGTCSAIAIGPTTLPSGVQETVYPTTTLTSTGGTAPFSFSEIGPLPTGLTMSSAGVLSGTPTTLGTFLFTVTATDANGCAGSRAYTVTVSVNKAVMTSPAPGSTLTSSTVTFNWTAGFGVTTYSIYVGRSVGAGDIFIGNFGTALSGTIAGLPTDGSALYVRLYSLIGGSWEFNDYTYTAPSASKAVMTSPSPGSTLSSSTVTFSWGAGSGVSQYALYVGTTVGGTEIYADLQGTSLTRTLGGLPTDGSPVYVRLWSMIAGGWDFNDYTYTALSASKAVMVSPSPGSTLASSTVSFTWNAGAGATMYALYVGTTPGGTEIYADTQGTNLSVTVGGLPTNGSPVNVRLWTLLGGVWQFNDYSYTAVGFSKAVMVSPTPGPTLTSSTVSFTWNAGTGATMYALYVGTTPGGTEIYADTQGTNLSVTVGGLPTNGSPVNVRLWTLLGGVWQFNDYAYTACTGCQ